MAEYTKKIKIGNIAIGGGEPIAIQSMLNVRADDIDGSVKQALALEKAGCEIIRAAVPTVDDAKLIYALKNAVKIPVVSDIHFDYKLALLAAEGGASKIRINPGNIGGEDRVQAVVAACKDRSIPCW